MLNGTGVLDSITIRPFRRPQLGFRLFPLTVKGI
jgi:hypothetical protein